MEISLKMTSNPAEQDSKFIMQQLEDFNLPFAGPPEYTLLRIFARNRLGELIGGLLGGTFWQWLHIEILWVDQSYRHAGLGKQLMMSAEDEARKRGCLHAYVDTFDFQAPVFYEKLGYKIWGVLEDFPPGFHRNYYQKALRFEESR